MRFVPAVRALCERARRPFLMLTIATAMASPGGVLLLRGGVVPPAHATGLPESATRIPYRDGSIAAAAWRIKALEREQDRVVQELRERFRAYGVSKELAEEIHRAAVEEDIDPKIAFGLVRVESSFRRTAVSRVGAVGYTQVLPSTARWLVPGITRSDLLQTGTNLRVGFRYLRYLVDRYDGDIRLALTAYNRGPGTVDRLLRQGRNPDNGYAAKVLKSAGAG